ncbi:hypothetical protein [Alloactinosynnema sp. L-07]|uniref:hypothetical protein n=1 Tax=Alloactinosynnema sp. L-07 TaxID=1653480 RepID=UPI00065EFE46|nr:hypothetical protein [Alloactinosynnema sp. L-07]CRK57049.1 hypothetical protein [Alloactinosynnema sp. L-07]
MSAQLAAAIVVAACLAGFGGWLARDVLRQRRSRAAAIRLALLYSPAPVAMGRHDGHSDEAVSVADLLIRAAEQGRALRLNWSADDTDPRGLATTTDDDWPTGVLPRIEDDMPDPSTTSAVAELPRREPGSIPEPLRPVPIQADPDLLDRVMRGLRRLE